MMKPISAEELAWTRLQPVVGTPSFTRLRAALEAAGLPVIEVVLHQDRIGFSFRLRRTETVCGMSKEQTLRRLITIFRASGFEVGFSEVAIAELNATTIHGDSLIAPIDVLAKRCEVPVEFPTDIPNGHNKDLFEQRWRS